MGYIKEALALLKKGKLKSLLRKVKLLFQKCSYLLRVQWEDRKFGGITVNTRKPSRFPEAGAYATQSTHYIWLDKIFQSMPLKKDAVFVDIGCGEGRVLTYLYNRGFRGKMTGIELDPDVAETARQRTARCPNITVLNINALESAAVLEDATVVYLFNPFNEEILSSFVELLERTAKHPVVVYYCNDLYRKVLDKRENWQILRRDILRVPNYPTRNYTVYGYKPEEKQD